MHQPYSILALSSLVVALTGCPSGGPPKPGETEFKAAVQTIMVYKEDKGTAFGNSSEAEALAKSFGSELQSRRATTFTGDDNSVLSGGQFLTYCELRSEGICFLVQVPKLKAYKGEVRDQLIDLAWETAAAVTKDLRKGGDRKLGVGLKGAFAFGGSATGMGNDAQPKERENSALVSTTPLYAFFAGGDTQPASSAEDVPAPAETNDTESPTPELKTGPIKIEYMKETPAKDPEKKD